MTSCVGKGNETANVFSLLSQTSETCHSSWVCCHHCSWICIKHKVYQPNTRVCMKSNKLTGSQWNWVYFRCLERWWSIDPVDALLAHLGKMTVALLIRPCQLWHHLAKLWQLLYIVGWLSGMATGASCYVPTLINLVSEFWSDRILNSFFRMLSFVVPVARK